MEKHDLHRLIAERLGRADRPNDGFLRIRLAVDRYQNTAQAHEAVKRHDTPTPARDKERHSGGTPGNGLRDRRFEPGR